MTDISIQKDQIPTIETGKAGTTFQVKQEDAADDFPASGLAGGPGLAIHHEPGLFLHMRNLQTDGINIAHLATIPHGNSILALGKKPRKPKYR